MKPAKFTYIRAASWQDAVEALSANDEARVLAGGQSLVPAMNLRLASPATLIDLQGIPDSDTVVSSEDCIIVGARLTHGAAVVDPHLGRLNPLIAEAAVAIGHPAIREQGTIGGSLAHADPAGEWPLVTSLLRAEILVLGPSGPRTIPAEDFVQFVFTTELEPDEVITGIQFQRRTVVGSGAYGKVARVRGDFALLGVGVVIDATTNGAGTELRIGVTGLDSKAVVWTRHCEGEPVDYIAERFVADLDASGRFTRSSWLERHGKGVLQALVTNTIRRALERVVMCA